MGLYDKYARLAGERLQFSDNGLTPFGTCIDEVYSATEGRIGNKKVILAGTNNYLGLTFNHDAISFCRSSGCVAIVLNDERTVAMQDGEGEAVKIYGRLP
jgi:hypothetical protein